ncbi:MAG: PD-(D/E)XK nuclease family protein [Gudongella sp.]|nr:PD-(D/E)XK nuclease family protein [Gudongella sp.]
MKYGRVYSGDFGNRRSQQLKQEYMELLSEGRGGTTYYILPNGELLRALRRRVIDETGGAFDIGISTFDDMVEGIIAGKKLHVIQRPIQLNIVKMAIRRLAELGRLQVFHRMADYDGFVDCVQEVIMEAKRALIDPESFSEISEGDSYLEEVSLIYGVYQEFLRENGLVDREGTYIFAVELLGRGEADFQGLERVIIDQFYDFRPVEIQILKQLLRMKIDVTINLPFGGGGETLLVGNTLKTLEGLGFEIIEEAPSEKSTLGTFAKSFVDQRETVDPEGKITIIRGESPQLEIKSCISRIKRLLMEGAEPGSIQVVATSSLYRDLFLELARKEQLNIKAPIKRSLWESRIIRGFIDILRLRESGGSKEDIINLIKSPIINREYIDNDLEISIRRLRFENLGDLKGMLRSTGKLEIDMNTLEKIHQLTGEIEELTEGAGEDLIKAHGEFVLRLLDSLELDRYVMDKSSLVRDFRWEINQLNALHAFRDIVQEMVQMDYIDWEISFKDFMDILRDYTLEKELIIQNPATNGIELLNPTNGRALIRDHKFIIGLNKSQYPSLDENNFLFAPKSLERLKGGGIKHLDYREKFENELLKISSIIGSTEKSLYLGTSSSAGGEDDLPSIFLARIIRTAGNRDGGSNIVHEEIEYESFINSSLDELSGKDDFNRHALWRYYQDRLEPEELMYFIQNSRELMDRVNRRLHSEHRRSSGQMDKYSGVLNSESIGRIIDRKIKDRVYSVSYIEDYIKCPYAFLLGRLFKIEETPREWQETKPLDRGQIFHSVLCSYYRKYRDDLEKNPQAFQVEETRDYLRSLVIREARAYGLDNISGGERLFILSMEETLMGYVSADIDRMRASKVKVTPYLMEEEFGENRSFRIAENGREIHFRGIIDRVDRMEDDSYILIDYKSSPYGKRTREDIDKGLSIQLPMYILSQGDRNVTGGYYGIISSGELYPALAIKGKAPFVSGRNSGAVDEEEFSRLLQRSRNSVMEAVKGIQEGYFAVAPMECSAYCIFRDICRYGSKEEVN